MRTVFLTGSGCEIYDCPPVTGPDCHGLEDAVCGLLENSTRTAPVCVDCPYPFMGYSCEFRCFHGTAVPPPSDVSNGQESGEVLLTSV